MPSSKLIQPPKHSTGYDKESQAYHSAVEIQTTAINNKADSNHHPPVNSPQTTESKDKNIPKIKKAVDVIHSSEDESELEPLEKITKKKTEIKQNSELHTKENESALRSGYFHEEGSDYEADVEPDGLETYF
jgi:hypothetical protein